MASDRELDGWLSKLAKAKSTRTSAGAAPLWQRRFFQLKGDMLYFWNTEEDAKGGPSTAKWSLDLGAKGAMATPFSDPTQPPDDSRIELIAGDEKFSFQADSEVEAEMWIAALTTPSRSGGGIPSAATPAGRWRLHVRRHGHLVGAISASCISIRLHGRQHGSHSRHVWRYGNDACACGRLRLRLHVCACCVTRRYRIRL